MARKMISCIFIFCLSVVAVIFVPEGVLLRITYTGRLIGVPFQASHTKVRREGISPVEVYERVRKSVISVAERPLQG